MFYCIIGWILKWETHCSGTGRIKEAVVALFPPQCLENWLNNWFLVLTFLSTHACLHPPCPQYTRFLTTLHFLGPSPLSYGVTKQNQVHLFMFWASLIALLVLALSVANSWNWPSIKHHKQMLWGEGEQHPSIPVSRRKSEDWGLLWGRTDVAQYPKYRETPLSAPVPPAITARKPMQILKWILLSASLTSIPKGPVC